MMEQAAVDFDWWHFALLQWDEAADEAACPFVGVCSEDSRTAAAAAATLARWRKDEAAVAAVLEAVKRLVAEEQACFGASAPVTGALTHCFSRLSL